MKSKFLLLAGIVALLIALPRMSQAQALTANGPTTFCQGGSVTLSVPLDSGVNYTWLQGNTVMAGQQSNQLVVTSSGLYRVIRNSAANCCDTSNSVAVQVNPLPTATINPSGSVTVYCGAMVPTLTTSPVLGATYQWFRDNVAIAGATGTSYTPFSVGVYHVVVSLNSCQQASPTLTIVGGAPPASGTLTYTSVNCSGQATLHISPSPGVTSHRWYRNSTLIATTQNTFSLVVSQSGSYYVQAVWHPQCMPATSNTVNVNISSPPSTIITAIGSTQLCVGDSVTLLAGPAYQTTWYRNGVVCGGGIGINSLRVGTPGTYSCTFNVSSPQGNPYQCQGFSSNTIQVTRRTGIAASIAPLGPTQICVGDSVILAAAPLPGMTYTWYRNNLRITGQTGHQLVARLPGIYRMTGSSLSSCIDSSNTIEVQVSALPTPTISISRLPQLCGNDSIQLSIGVGDFVAWFRNDTLLTSGQQLTSIWANVEGNYHCVVTNNGPPGSGQPSCSGRSTNTVVVTRTVAPSPQITSSASPQLCGNDSVQLSIPAADTVKWYRNDTLVNAGANLTSIWVQAAGDYHCVVSTIGSPGSGQPSCTGRSANTITVIRIPQPLPPNLALVGSTIFSSLGGVHEWFRNGILVPGVSDSFLVTTAPGIYQSRRIMSSCYSDTSNTIQITGVGLASTSQNGINVYPNPTSGKFYVTFNESKSSEITMRVYSMHGALVKENSDLHHSPTEPIELDLTSHAPGIYFLSVQQNAAISYVRLVLTR